MPGEAVAESRCGEEEEESFRPHRNNSNNKARAGLASGSDRAGSRRLVAVVGRAGKAARPGAGSGQPAEAQEAEGGGLGGYLCRSVG